MNRRTLLSSLGLTAAALGAGTLLLRPGHAQEVERLLGFMVQEAGPYEWDLSDEEWRARLTPDQYQILRREGTERAFTSPLDKFFEDGTYHCAGCDLPVYGSAAKYDSGTGWPSYYGPVDDDAIRVKSDNKLWAQRTEVHCRRCGGHFGHIFRDGPQPTGLRHCLNGLALTFKAA